MLCLRARVVVLEFVVAIQGVDLWLRIFKLGLELKNCSNARYGLCHGPYSVAVRINFDKPIKASRQHDMIRWEPDETCLTVYRNRLVTSILTVICDLLKIAGW